MSLGSYSHGQNSLWCGKYLVKNYTPWPTCVCGQPWLGSLYKAMMLLAPKGDLLSLTVDNLSLRPYFQTLGVTKLSAWYSFVQASWSQL